MTNALNLATEVSTQREGLVFPEKTILRPGTAGRAMALDKTYTYVLGALKMAHMYEAVKALVYMREKHKTTKPRSDGQPYMVHPLEMARWALNFESPFITDETYATILLHDVPEETGESVETLPFPEAVRRGVKYMTVTQFKNETNFEKKRRYANELLESWDSTVCKGVDMIVNFHSMIGSFAPDKVRKNIVEADMLRQPVLKMTQRKWPERSSLIFQLRETIKLMVDNLAIVYEVRLTDPMFQNFPMARDYSFLITGEPAPEWYVKDMPPVWYHEAKS